MPLFTGIADEIPDDEEVARVPHLLDHRQLVLESPVVFLDRVPQRTGRLELPQPRQPLRVALRVRPARSTLERHPFRDTERRQVILPLRNRDVAPLGDEQRVAQRVFMATEHAAICSGGLQEELIARIAEPLRVVDRLARADAQQDVVRLEVALPQVVNVVGSNERQIQLAGERNDALVDDLLLLDPLILHLEEEVIRAENVAKPRRRFERGTRLLDSEGARHFAL